MALKYGVEIVGISETGSFCNFTDRHVGLRQKLRRLIQTQTAQIGRNAAAGGSLENILKAVRGFCTGRIIAVFGCGGDRDPFKRPVMGKIAAELSDLAIVTSDNPRTEDPYKILRQILAGMQDTETPYEVIESRVSAIGRAMELAQKDDVIVLCGKGHETYQEIGHEKHHLDEREVVASYLEANA